MDCNCVPHMINGIVYGLGIAVAVWAITWIFIDMVQGG